MLNAEHAQEVRSSETLFATWFYLQILNPCINQHPLKWKLELATSSRRHLKTQILPTYYIIYEQDTPAVSSSIESMFVTNDTHSTYQYYFIYFKFGQQQAVTLIPISLSSTNLYLQIADPSQLLGVSIHLAINFKH